MQCKNVDSIAYLSNGIFLYNCINISKGKYGSKLSTFAKRVNGFAKAELLPQPHPVRTSTAFSCHRKNLQYLTFQPAERSTIILLTYILKRVDY